MGASDVNAAPLFWPISRDLLRNEQNNTTNINKLRSLVSYQILFGGPLLIRDSDYINSLAFRSSVIRTLEGEADDNARFFRTLLDERYVLIARREENTLGEIAERLGGAGGGGHTLIRPEWYRSDAADIVYLESNRFSDDQSMRYSVRQAAAYYTRQVQTMLSESLEPYVDEHFRRRAAERVAALVQQHGTLAWAFFMLGGAFWEGFSEKEQQEYHQFFDLVLGQAPHASFIPDTLGLNPIYMHDLARAFDLWRGHLRHEGELVDTRVIKLGNGFSFSDYIEYLCLLPFDAVVRLVNSGENAAFRRACELFSTQKATLKEVEASYSDYRKIIDSELLRRHLVRPAAGPKTDLRAFVVAAKDEMIDQGVQIVCDELIGAAIPFWRLGLTLFYRLIRGEWPEQSKSRAVKEADASEIAGEIQRLQGGSDRLRENIIFGASGTQERLVEIESADNKADVCVTLPERSSG
jgi:hypothetical protein